ncbi:MAG: hypothetical protein V4597_15845 [Pseudomonadota bacterium]
MLDENKAGTLFVVSDEDLPNAASDPSFFDGRLLIDILAWDWNLSVAIGDRVVSGSKLASQGLDYGRDFTIHGHVRAPRELRGKTIKVTLSPFGPKVRFGRGGLQHVGEFTPPSEGFEFEAVLMLPEEAIASTATSLGSRWKYLQIKTDDEGPDGAKASAYFFHARIHPNLKAWANAD